MERLHLGGIAAGQVVLLAEVVAQVVEFAAAVLIPLDQFPVAVADRAAGPPPWLP